MAGSWHRRPGAAICKKVVLVDLSRQQIIKALRRAGLDELADQAEATLPDPIDAKTANQFCAAHGVTTSVLMDRMGASP
jgi:hypothetical protein